MKKYFTYKDEKSDKFWSVEMKDNSLTVVYGRTGTAGTTNTKKFVNPYKAAVEADKLVNEKLKKGYKENKGKQASKFGETEFWGLIERTKKKTSDSSEQIELLTELLSERPEEDIVAFEKVFLKLHAVSYQSDLWAAAYTIRGGCSDDSFDYFRGWLIAQGKDVFYNALKDPETLARVIKQEDGPGLACEEMLSAASNAYEIKTGNDTIYDQIPPGFIKHRKINLDWEDEDLKDMFPKLWKKFVNY